MKFTKHQKEIIKRISSGEIYDIYSYLNYFKMLGFFKIDKSKIEEKYFESENGETYKVLKQGVSTFSTYMDPTTFGIQTSINKVNEEDYEYKTAQLVFEKIKATVTYKETEYTFNPCDDSGVYIAKSFNHIKEFISIWSYLHKELYVLEVPKAIRKVEIGLFFTIHNKKIEEEARRKEQEAIVKKGGLVPLGGAIHSFDKNNLGENLKSLIGIPLMSNVPQVDAYKFTDEVLLFNEDNFRICDYYLDKKIISTPELELFIKNNYKTSEQINFYWALVPAYLAVIISLATPFIQKQDDTEIIKMQIQLSEIKREISKLDITNKQIEKLAINVDKLNVEKYDDKELKDILLEIQEAIKNLQDTK